MKFKREIDLNNDGINDVEISYKLNPQVGAFIGKVLAVIFVVAVVGVGLVWAAIYTLTAVEKTAAVVERNAGTIGYVFYGVVMAALVMMGVGGAVLASPKASIAVSALIALPWRLAEISWGYVLLLLEKSWGCVLLGVLVLFVLPFVGFMVGYCLYLASFPPSGGFMGPQRVP